MTDETVVDVLEVAEKVLVEVSERVKVRPSERLTRADKVCIPYCCAQRSLRSEVGGSFERE